MSNPRERVRRFKSLGGTERGFVQDGGRTWTLHWDQDHNCLDVCAVEELEESDESSTHNQEQERAEPTRGAPTSRAKARVLSTVAREPFYGRNSTNSVDSNDPRLDDFERLAAGNGCTPPSTTKVRQRVAEGPTRPDPWSSGGSTSGQRWQSTETFQPISSHRQNDEQPGQEAAQSPAQRSNNGTTNLESHSTSCEFVADHRRVQQRTTSSEGRQSYREQSRVGFRQSQQDDSSDQEHYFDATAGQPHANPSRVPRSTVMSTVANIPYY